jgi:hypothetical protein
MIPPAADKRGTVWRECLNSLAAVLLLFTHLPLALGQAGSYASADYSVPLALIDGGGHAAVSADYTGLFSLGGFGELSGSPPVLRSVRNLQGFCARINDPPVIREDTLFRAPGKSVKVIPRILTSNDHDSENDELTIISMTSDKGAILTVDGTWYIYSPPVEMNETDTVSCLVSDGWGNLSRGIVTIVVTDDNLPTLNILSVTQLSDPPAKRISFIGIPGRTYRVQVTTDLANPDWITIGSVEADSTGRYQFVDDDPANYPVRFYRALSP